MKLILAFSLLLSLPALASIDVLKYRILSGKFHQGGSCSSEIISQDPASGLMLVRLNYEVVKRPLVPVPNEYLKGNSEQEIPLDFLDERGYLELKRTGSRKFGKSTLVYIGAATVKGMTGGHHVRILPNNGKSQTDVYYHPNLPELGWAKVVLTLKTDIPLLKNYSMEAVLVD